MTDIVSKKKRSEIMSRIRSKGSKIEVSFRKELWKQGFRYSKNSTKYFGKPDVVLLKHKAVIFIDSCFWHGCKKHCRIPSVRKKYWTEKITRNKERDKEVSKHYKKQGWKIFRIWEHDLKKKNYSLDFKNPNGSTKVEHKEPEEIITGIESSEKQIAKLLGEIKKEL